MNKLITIIIIAISLVCQAKGIYIVSGGDFRICDGYWKVVSTEQNQTMRAAPNMYFVSGSDKSKASIKIDDEAEYRLSEITNPFQYTFKNAGVHTVKLYDPNGIVNRLSCVIDPPQGVTYQDIDYQTTFKEIKFPKSATQSMGAYDFYKQSNLETVIFPDGMTSIGYLAFGRSGLKNVVIPNGVVNIGHPFWECYSIQSVSVPDTVREFNGYCFTGGKIQDLEFGSNVTNISGGAFSNNQQLKTITLMNKNVVINNGFPSCPNIETINYAGSLEDWNANPSLVERFGEAVPNGMGNGIIAAKTSGAGTLQGKAKVLNYNYTK